MAAAIASASGARLAAQSAQLPAGNAAGGGAGSAYQTALKQATSLANADIASQIAPLQSQIGYQQKLLPQEQQALTDEFNQLMPYAQQQAAYTGEFNRGVASDAQQIFQQAGTNLNTMQQNNAAQAQQMAQQIGGPVSTGQFTDALTPYQSAIGQGASVAGLNALELGAIGTDQAYQFSGQVLPAMAAEQHQTVAANINDQIQKLKDQITTIQGTKSNLVDAKLPALLTAAHNYQLQVASLAEKKLQDKRSYTTTMRALDQANAKLKLATRQEAFVEKTTGTKLDQGQQALDQSEQKITQNEQALGIKTQQQKETARHNAQMEGISYDKYLAYNAHMVRSDSNASKRNQIQETKNFQTVLDVAMGGSSSNKPVSVYEKHYLNKSDPLYVQTIKAIHDSVKPTLGQKATTFPKNVFYDPKTQQYYTEGRVSTTPAAFAQQHGMSGTPISDPNALFRLLKNQFPDKSDSIITDAIRVKLGIPNWNYGDAMPGTQKAAPTTRPKGPAAVTPPTTALGVTGNAGSPEKTYTGTPTQAAALAKMPIGQLTDLAIKYGFKPSPVRASRQSLIDFIYHATSS